MIPMLLALMALCIIGICILESDICQRKRQIEALDELIERNALGQKSPFDY